MPKLRNHKGSGQSDALPRGRKKKTRLFPWIWVGAVAFLFFGAAVVWRRGWGIHLLAPLLRLGIMVAASVADLRARQVPNAFSGAMLLAGFYPWNGIGNLLWRLAGAVAVFLFLYIWYRCAPKKALGGADIKMLTALTFALGKGILPTLVYMLGFCLLLLLPVYFVRRKKGTSAGVPLFPLMTAGMWLYFMI